MSNNEAFPVLGLEMQKVEVECLTTIYGHLVQKETCTWLCFEANI